MVLAIPGLAGAVPTESPASWGLVLLKKEMKRGCRASLISAMWHACLMVNPLFCSGFPVKDLVHGARLASS